MKGGCNRVEGETTGREVMVGFMETGKYLIEEVVERARFQAKQ